MIGKTYLSRLCDAELQLALQSSGAVLIEGAKWCGKTSTASKASSSVLYMQDPDNAGSYQAMTDTKPSLLLKGETPRLIDEWQMAPVLWDAVRFEVDKRAEEYDCIVMTAAVCDFRPEEVALQKIKKEEKHSLELIKNPDILSGIKGNKDIKKIGFALETHNAFENGKKKLEEKGLDIIVINEKTEKNDPFGGGPAPRDYTVIGKKGENEHFEKIEKNKMAQIVVERIGQLL